MFYLGISGKNGPVKPTMGNPSRPSTSTLITNEARSSISMPSASVQVTTSPESSPESSPVSSPESTPESTPTSGTCKQNTTFSVLKFLILLYRL